MHYARKMVDADLTAKIGDFLAESKLKSDFLIKKFLFPEVKEHFLYI